MAELLLRPLALSTLWLLLRLTEVLVLLPVLLDRVLLSPTGLLGTFYKYLETSAQLELQRLPVSLVSRASQPGFLELTHSVLLRTTSGELTALQTLPVLAA